jgi:hypothetical protein
MCLDEGKVAVDETKLLPHVTADSLYDGMRASAMRALEIAVLHQRYRRVAGAEGMISFCYGNS